jgi:WhiB family redox-sensing transcriptional regulator
MDGQNGSTRLLSRANTAWMEAGVCQNKDEDGKIFFPDAGNNAFAAKRMCARCPVREKCLDWSIETRQMYGVWGGVAEKKRRKMMHLRHGRTPYYAVMEVSDDEDISVSPAVGGTR